MKNLASVSGVALLAMSMGFVACSTQEEMVAKPAAKPAAPAPAAAAKTEAKAEAKAPAAKATKIAGDVGLLDTEKNFSRPSVGLSLRRSPISVLARRRLLSTPRKATRASLRASSMCRRRASRVPR